VLRGVGEELGRPPTARDIDERRGRMPSKSLYWHTFGSLSSALREAGFDVAVGRNVSSGRSSRAPRSHVASAACRSSPTGPPRGQRARPRPEPMLTEWQVYRMFESRRGAWATFQFLVRGRLLEEGAGVGPDGSVT